MGRGHPHRPLSTQHMTASDPGSVHEPPKPPTLQPLFLTSTALPGQLVWKPLNFSNVTQSRSGRGISCTASECEYPRPRSPPASGCGRISELLTGLPLGPSSPGGPLGPGGPAAPEGPDSPFSPLSPLGPWRERLVSVSSEPGPSSQRAVLASVVAPCSHAWESVCLTGPMPSAVRTDHCSCSPVAPLA